MVIDQDTGAHSLPEKPGAALAWAQPQEPPGEPMDDVRPNFMFVHEVIEGVSRLCPFWIDVAGSNVTRFTSQPVRHRDPRR